MASNFVNLDAIIRREDWEAMPTETSSEVQMPSGLSFKAIEFEHTGLAFQLLRKPEFQRETASWEPEKVADLVKCFVEGDLIPSIIIWKNVKSGNLFVIDGAHRLGALIAWVHDDYGDRELSRKFFNDLIPPEQDKAAKLTRKLISASVGSYQTIKHSGHLPNTVKEGRFARQLLERQVIVQSITGASKKAEESFFKINQKAAPITPTELQLIGSRDKASGIATRALVRSGVGHRFWSKFPKETQTQIETIASEVNSLLFKPTLSNPISIGLDLPIGGRGYSTEAVSLLLAFVHLTIAPPKKKSKKGEPKEHPTPIPDDLDGEVTVQLLKNVRKLTKRMAGKEFPSLGLHSAVYFYSATGRFQPTAFLAVASLIKELEQQEGNQFIWFTLHRLKFERFLTKHRYLVNQMVLKYGSMEKSHEPMLSLFRTVLHLAAEGKKSSEILKKVIEIYPYLREQTAVEYVSGESEFTTGIKNAIIRKAGLEKVHLCTICGAPIHPNAISFDHSEDKKFGGKGTVDNGALTHPFCNTTKDQLQPHFKVG